MLLTLHSPLALASCSSSPTGGGGGQVSPSTCIPLPNQIHSRIQNTYYGIGLGLGNREFVYYLCPRVMRG